jgi:transposase
LKRVDFSSINLQFGLALLGKAATTVVDMDTADALPNDPIECQRLLLAAFKEATQLERRVVESEQRLKASTQRVTESEQEASELKRVLEETAVSFEELRQEHAAALEELAQLKRWIYGQRRERIVEDAGQQHLFELSPASDTNQTSLADEEEASEDSANTRRRRRQKRKLDLDHLPHHRHELDVSDEDKVCSCCDQPKEQMGEDITTVLEYEPAKLEVHEYVRPKFVCRKCKDGVSSPPPPKRPIDRGLAGPGLISHVIVSKFSDHQPLYRLEDIYVRHGVHLARSTLADWVRSAAELLKPLYELMRLQVLLSAVMWTDDTPVTVLVGGEEGSRKGLSRLPPSRCLCRLRRNLPRIGRRSCRSCLLGACAKEVFRCRKEPSPSGTSGIGVDLAVV